MDDRLAELIEHWNEIDWYDKKRIAWVRFREISGIDFKILASLIACFSVIGVMIGENHINHIAGLLSIIVLLYFYALLIDLLLSWGKRRTENQ